jgi:hypothetical protein
MEKESILASQLEENYKPQKNALFMLLQICSK